MSKVIEPWHIQNNIYSRSPDPFLRALTNPTLRSKLKRNYTVTYAGYGFGDADCAFFAFREVLPRETEFELLVDINAAKFMQHPILTNEVIKRSRGYTIQAYFDTLVHRTKANSRKWEGNGHESLTIRALYAGYLRASSGLLLVEPEVKSYLANSSYNPVDSRALLRYSQQLGMPLTAMVIDKNNYD